MKEVWRKYPGALSSCGGAAKTTDTAERVKNAVVKENFISEDGCTEELKKQRMP